MSYRNHVFADLVVWDPDDQVAAATDKRARVDQRTGVVVDMREKIFYRLKKLRRRRGNDRAVAVGQLQGYLLCVGTVGQAAGDDGESGQHCAAAREDRNEELGAQTVAGLAVDAVDVGLAAPGEITEDEAFAAEIGEGNAVCQAAAGPAAEYGNAAREIDAGDRPVARIEPFWASSLLPMPLTADTSSPE